MTVKTKEPKRGRNWYALEIEFMERPTVTVSQFATEHEIPLRTLNRYANPSDGLGWRERREQYYQQVRRENMERIAGILAEKSNDDLSSFKALEDRVKRLALAALELIIPPEDAPMEAQMAAQTRLQAMSAKQLSEIINTSLRTLTETGRHRRLLSGQATALFGRADTPDVLIDEPIESAEALEMRSRMAQKALRASLEGSPLDVDFAVLPSPGESAPTSPIPPDSPESAYPRSDSPDSPTSPTSHNAQDTAVRLACMTSKGQADNVPLGGL